MNLERTVDPGAMASRIMPIQLCPGKISLPKAKSLVLCNVGVVILPVFKDKRLIVSVPPKGDLDLCIRGTPWQEFIYIHYCTLGISVSSVDGQVSAASK